MLTTLSNTLMRTRTARYVMSGLLLITTACTTGAALRQDAETIKGDIARAREAGAVRCAPRELAMAESHHDFLQIEVDQGDFSRASRHAEVARANVSRALAITDPVQCSEKRVLIQETPVPQIVRKDSDGDGLFDDEDSCPLEPGPSSNKGCPIKDSDGDGLNDDVDQCPADAGPVSNKGCPIKDSDGDGVLDPDDGCPNEPGPASNKGCPLLDRDGDAVTDDIDQCPDVPGDPTNNGCPKKTLVVVRDDRIEIKQQVHFASGKAKILPDSFELLSQIAAVFRSNPTMRVMIEGHTDNVGSAAKNLKLSDQRAKAVRQMLIDKQGIAADRLEAVGYGQTKPIAANATAKGRALNRRVEFNILAK